MTKTAKETIAFCKKRMGEMYEDWDYMDFAQSDLIDLLREVVDFIEQPSPTNWAIRQLQENAADQAFEWQRCVKGKQWLEWYDGYRFKSTMHWLNEMG